MPKGIANLGNTCSINALLQCLAHSRSIQRFFKDHGGMMTYPLTRHLADLICRLNESGEEVIDPRQFLSVLYNKCQGVLVHGEQHDVCEICTLLCDKVAEECFDASALRKYTLSKEDEAYWIKVNVQYARILQKALTTMRQHNIRNECTWLDMMQGVIVTQTQCDNAACFETYHNFEPFIVLSIEIPQDVKTLYDCLDAFFAPEKIQDWVCDKCKSRCATRVMRLWKIPRIFAISMKRFGANLRKDRRHIDIPETFSISPSSVIGPQYIHRKNKIMYKLCSVALHHGCLGGGHYTAIGRGSQEGEWYHYDDTNVTRIPHPNVTESYMMVYELPR